MPFPDLSFKIFRRFACQRTCFCSIEGNITLLKLKVKIREAGEGIEPSHIRFADERVTASPSGQARVFYHLTKLFSKRFIISFLTACIFNCFSRFVASNFDLYAS